MSKRIQHRDSDFHQLMPHFLWLLRDVDLTIGSSSPTEWLLRKLQVPRCKEITEALTNSFSSIECIFLPPPAATSEILQDIIQRKDQLSPQFTDQLEKAKNTLLSKIEPKRCKEVSFTGYSLASLITECVADINGQSYIPCLEATWKAAVDVEVQQYGQRFVTEYEKEMSFTLKQLLPIEEGLPDSTDSSTLMGIHNQFMAKNLSLLDQKLKSLVPLKDVFDDFWTTAKHNFISKIVEKDASGEITGGKLSKFLFENHKLSGELCSKTYDAFYDQIVGSKLRNSIAEGIPYDIAADVRQFEEQYYKIASGPAKAEVYSMKRLECEVEEKQLVEIPGHIEDLQIIGISSDRIKLKWHTPSVNPAAAHSYEVYMVEEQGNFVLIKTTENCYALIKHLKSNKHYTFVVRARNERFWGNHISHMSAKTTLNNIARSAVGVGTFLAFTVGSPVAFPSIFTAGTVTSIRSDIREQRYGSAAAKGAVLTLMPLTLPIGVLGTSIIAPVIAIDAFSQHASKGDVSEHASV